MRPVEFFQCRKCIVALSDDGYFCELTEADTGLVDFLFEKIKTEYAEAFEALCHLCEKSRQNIRYFRFRVVERFLRCNFSRIDNVNDIDTLGCFHLEYVDCPLRGCCIFENVVCLPKPSSGISVAERRVMELLYEGLSRQEIADRLYLSIYTVQNHIRNVFTRLGLRDTPDFIRYANAHNLFRNEI